MKVKREGFAVVYVASVAASLAFYCELLGYEEIHRQPPEGTPGYAGLKLGNSRLGLVHSDWPRDRFSIDVGEGPRFELFVYVADVDEIVAKVRGAGGPVLREPEDMPWGERVAHIADPDGNPVGLAAPI